MRRAVPITMGSTRAASLLTSHARVTDAWFPAGAVLQPHTHDRPIMAVMLTGSFVTRIRTRELACEPARAWTEPAGEPHANHTGSAGARVLVMEVGGESAEPKLQHTLLDDITLQHNLHVAADAHRALAELHTRDDFSPLVLDSLIIMMLSEAARLAARQRFHATPPAWLLRARDYLHDHFRDAIKLTDLARECEVAPAVLTRFFQRSFGMTPGEYARACRIDWCIQQLLTTSTAISTIAFQAGFADQSHFTRAFTRHVGLPPAAYRRATRA